MLRVLEDVEVDVLPPSHALDSSARQGWIACR